MTKSKIVKLPESEKRGFDEVKQQVSKPILDFMDFDHRHTLDWSAPADASVWTNHLYQNDDGLVPKNFNGWETFVLQTEMKREDFGRVMRLSTKTGSVAST